ncbi:unnamed protein product [Parnassius apollo]|uniref:(apollo) hypothetical protein n=1 Tax=Parnassius apollo TaxID=110799 RepID=A0A8S3WUW0_PARAO|nr:unnamed protein product [Parnassius apollo]
MLHYDHKKKKLSNDKPTSLFRDDESNHDPYSDDDGEYVSDYNHEPNDKDEDSSSDCNAIFDIFKGIHKEFGLKADHGFADYQNDNGEQVDQNSVNKTVMLSPNVILI